MQLYTCGRALFTWVDKSSINRNALPGLSDVYIQTNA